MMSLFGRLSSDVVPTSGFNFQTPRPDCDDLRTSSKRVSQNEHVTFLVRLINKESAV